MNLDLNKLRHSPFSVPAGYFDSFSAQMASRLNAPQKPSVHFYSPWLYVAAAVFALMVLLSPASAIWQHRAQQTAAENYELYLYSQLDADIYYDYFVDEK